MAHRGDKEGQSQRRHFCTAAHNVTSSTGVVTEGASGLLAGRNITAPVQYVGTNKLELVVEDSQSTQLLSGA